jgi:hypothetical protein
MKKIILTMIAIAFSLSAFSETYYEIGAHKQGMGKAMIVVWCINEYVFIDHRGSAGTSHTFVQMNHHSGRPMTCEVYKSELEN